ncbi:MAG TPA: YraN family protein [Herpetosiphonaceae bacterium]
MGDQRRAVGRQGEVLAAAYLQRKGYGIIATNWRCAAGEIDLITMDGPALVFVEVRTRRGSTAGLAEESVTRAKQRRLVRLAQRYLQNLDDARTPWLGPWRIDVVAIHIAPGTSGTQIRHLQHAVEDLES